MEQLISVFQEATEDVHSVTKEYRQFSAWIEDAQDKWEDFTPQEREAFRTTFQRFQQFARDTIPPDELESIRAELQNAFNEPLQEAIKDHVVEISNSFDLDMWDSEIEAMYGTFGDLSREELIDLREAYSELQEIIDEAPEAVTRYMGKYIEENRSRITSPLEDLLPELTRASDVFHDLRELNELIESTEWGGRLESREIGIFPRSWLSHSGFSVDSVQTDVESIDEIYSGLEELSTNIGPMLRAEFSSILEQDPEEFEFAIGELADEIDNLEEILSDVSATLDVIQALNEHNMMTDASEDLRASFEEITGEYREISDLWDSHEALQRSIESWLDDTASAWEVRVSIVEVFTDTLDFSEPDLSIDRGEFRDQLMSDTGEALDNLEELQDYIQSKEDQLTDSIRESSVNLLYSLIREGHVPISEYGMDSVRELHESIELEVGILEND